jgi:hypothetical protein
MRANRFKTKNLGFGTPGATFSGFPTSKTRS